MKCGDQKRNVINFEMYCNARAHELAYQNKVKYFDSGLLGYKQNILLYIFSHI